MGTIVIHCLVIQLLKYLFVARAIIPARTTAGFNQEIRAAILSCACVRVCVCTYARTSGT